MGRKGSWGGRRSRAKGGHSLAAWGGPRGVDPLTGDNLKGMESRLLAPKIRVHLQEEGEHRAAQHWHHRCTSLRSHREHGFC